MKSWKEVPHLFANGKFFARNKHFNKDGRGNTNLRGTMLGNVDFENYILEARPISDMSDEEMNKGFPKYSGLTTGRACGMLKQRLRIRTTISVDQFLYLLSIGVYPGPQGDFKTGEVIARYENKEG